MIYDNYGNRRFYGMYRGIVIENQDPKNESRLKLKIPQVLHDQVSDWAWAMHQPGVTRSIPSVGTGVWVSFEGGDPSYPVWTGTFNSSTSGNFPTNNLNYGAFSDYTDQTIASTTTGYAMRFGTTDEANNVRITDNTKVTFDVGGTYNIQWSGQFQNTDSQLADAEIWIKKNGVDIPGTTGRISIPNKHGGVNGHSLNGWNFVFTVSAGDYYELWWMANATTVSIQHYVAGTAPVRPSTASLILTVTQVK